MSIDTTNGGSAPAATRLNAGNGVMGADMERHQLLSGLAPQAGWLPLAASEHVVQLYESDSFLLQSLSEFICAGQAAGDVCIVVATPAHRAELDQRLQAAGLDVAAARAAGQYLPLDAAEMLAAFMVAGAPDPSRFAELFGRHIAQGQRPGRQVRIFGEMVALLWAEGQHEAALRLEALWNELHSAHAFVLFCAYPIHGFGGEALAQGLIEVCAAHGRVLPAESYTALSSADERLRAITRLQQQAKSLEAEIAARKAAEAALRAVKTDLSARVAAEAIENARLYQAAQDAIQVRDQFLSVASHELKTPLTSLLGNAELLQRRAERDGLLGGGARSLRVIVQQARRLSRMIQGLLSVSRIETGQLAIERAPLDLCALVRRLVEEAQLALDRHSVDCQTPDEPLIIEGDEVRLEQVVQNLLTNAVKYSPDGGAIVVRVERLGDQALLQVADSGIGVPSRDLPHLFQRFYRASNTTSQHLSGLGLGLYVVREIVSLHGGAVGVESREGAGSTFSVSLPLGEAHAPVSRADNAEPGAGASIHREGRPLSAREQGGAGATSGTQAAME